jgi:hypothetical protein
MFRTAARHHGVQNGPAVLAQVRIGAVEQQPETFQAALYATRT